MRYFRFYPTLVTFTILLTCLVSRAESRLFFHWGGQDGISAMLETLGFPNGSAFLQDFNFDGSRDLNQELFSYLRSQYKDAESAVKGSALYVCENPFTSRSFGNSLAILEVTSPGPVDQQISAVPDQRQAQWDSRMRPEALDSYPMMAGPYEVSESNQSREYYAIYHPSRSETRLLLRAPQPGDEIRVWDQLSGGTDAGKLTLLNRLALELLKARDQGPLFLTRASLRLFSGMAFDPGFGYFDYHLQLHRESSRWSVDLLRPLSAFITYLPRDSRTESLLTKWRKLPSQIDAGVVRALKQDKDFWERLTRDEHILGPDRVELLEELLRFLPNAPSGVREFVTSMILDLAPKALQGPSAIRVKEALRASQFLLASTKIYYSVGYKAVTDEIQNQNLSEALTSFLTVISSDQHWSSMRINAALRSFSADSELHLNAFHEFLSAAYASRPTIEIKGRVFFAFLGYAALQSDDVRAKMLEDLQQVVNSHHDSAKIVATTAWSPLRDLSKPGQEYVRAIPVYRQIVEIFPWLKSYFLKDIPLKMGTAITPPMNDFVAELSRGSRPSALRCQGLFADHL